MSVEHLVGRQVVAIVSDPWDFNSQHGTGPFVMAVESAGGDELLLRLANALTYNRVAFDRVVATARYVNDRLVVLAEGDRVSVNLTPVPSQTSRQEVKDALESAKRWRGWHLIGTISVT